MSCLICQDAGQEPLQDNTACSCKYKCHSSCWIDYVNANNELKCPMCRKDITVKPKPKPKTPKTRTAMTSSETATRSTPYTSRLEPIEDVGTHISYQEFRDIVTSSNQSYQNTVIEVRQPTTQSTPSKPVNSEINKFYKVVACLCITAAFIVLIMLLL